jgi:hypothetical protein
MNNNIDNRVDQKVVDKNASNGILTKIFGPPLWEALHCITFGYPLEPTDEQKREYKSHFTTLQYVLPCIFCRRSYAEYISTEPTKLTDEVMTNRETLTKWLYLLHERVNSKLGVRYGVTFEQVKDKYESYRAKCDPTKHGCSMPLDLKAQAFIKANKKDYNIIDYDIAVCFTDYAAKRGIKLDKLKYYEEKSKNIRSFEWETRNKECGDIVSFMRIKGIGAVEQDGEFKDLPTVEELLLISRLCSTMCREDLFTIISKLGHKLDRYYKLIPALVD